MKSKSTWKCENPGCCMEPTKTVGYEEIAIIGVPTCLVCEEVMSFVAEQICTNTKEEFAEKKYKLGKDFYVSCPDEEALLEYAKDGGWETINDLENETGVLREELIGKWFLIIGGGEGSRVFIEGTDFCLCRERKDK